MKNYIIVLGFLLAYIFTFIPDNPHWYTDQSRIILLFIWGFWSARISIRYHYYFLISMALFFTGRSAIEVFASPYTHFGENSVLLDGPSAQALFLFTCLISLVSLSSERLIRMLHETYEWAAVMTAVLTLYGRYGSTGVHSVDSAFMALMVPSLVFRKRLSLVDLFRIGVVMIAILTSHVGATGVFALASAVMALLLLEYRKKVGTIYLIGGFFLILMLGYLYQGSSLIQGSGRVLCWETVFHWWKDNVNVWLGTGLGTFQILGPSVQSHAGMTEMFFYMHNEYLQILFEQGILGLVLALVVYALALRKTYLAQSWVFISLVTLSVIMLTQSPLRITFLGVYVVVLLREALFEQSRNTPPKRDWKEENRLLNYVYNAQ